jgi:hypothetical protein
MNFDVAWHFIEIGFGTTLLVSLIMGAIIATIFLGNALSKHIYDTWRGTWIK